MSNSTSNSVPASGTLTGPSAGPPVIPLSEYAVQQARVFYGVTIPLAVLVLGMFGARIYQRIHKPSWAAGADDLFLTLGVVGIPHQHPHPRGTRLTRSTQLLAIVDWGLVIPATPLTPKLYPADEATGLVKYTIIAIPIWSLCMTCIKTSIALMLLRIQRQKLWQAFLYTVIAVQAIYGVGNAIFVWFQCRPIEAMWNPFIPNAVCLPTSTLTAVSNTGAGINIATDILLSLAPIAFLRKLNRPLRERVAIGVLMGIGLIASFSSVVKTIKLKAWNDPTADTWAVGISISTWTIIEEQLAILAACMPALKPLLESALSLVGLSLTSTRRPSQYRRATGESTFPNKDVVSSGHTTQVTANCDFDIPLSTNMRSQTGVAVTTDTTVLVSDKDYSTDVKNSSWLE